MEVILSKQVQSLTGSLGRGFGYFIVGRTNKKGAVRFFSQRSRHGAVPTDGHWRFIVACAELAQNKLHIADVRIDRVELYEALYEAHCFQAARQVRANADAYTKLTYNAADIINLKITFGL